MPISSNPIHVSQAPPVGSPWPAKKNLPMDCTPAVAGTVLRKFELVDPAISDKDLINQIRSMSYTTTEAKTDHRIGLYAEEVAPVLELAGAKVDLERDFNSALRAVNNGAALIVSGNSQHLSAQYAKDHREFAAHTIGVTDALFGARLLKISDPNRRTFGYISRYLFERFASDVPPKFDKPEPGHSLYSMLVVTNSNKPTPATAPPPAAEPVTK